MSAAAAAAAAAAALRYVRAIPHLLFFYNLHDHERKVYSQEGSDGVLEYVFAHLTPSDKFYVEFGTEDATECVTRHLWERYGWDGLLMDGGGVSKDARVIRNHFLRSDNIVELFKLYNVPIRFDYLSVDIDRNDFFVATSIFEAGYRPNVVSMEVNRNFNLEDSYTIKLDDAKVWDGTSSFGLSPLAATRLLNRFGYHVVGYDKLGVNVFAVRRGRVVDYLHEKTGYEYTEEEVQMLLPTFEYVYSAHPGLHVESTKVFRQTFDKSKWDVVGQDGRVVSV
ncbi:hypothetical protein DFJ73DRAFT_841473 [Zopfochytrium polystomum]|nr:hypothetical protein DFJ73DRAFT_841473 [Zopfochytrium polystomum]